jgi:hypothetical protein
MPDKEQTNAGLAQPLGEPSPIEEGSTDLSETEMTGDSRTLGRSIPRPATSLDSPPRGEIGKFTVLLLDDISSAPVLEDVELINKEATTEARTPLMTVILAIIARNGGSMVLEDLASQVGQSWNRQFPASPFDLEQFIYVLVRSADNIRVREQS